jgi:predicted peroxiredoxin
MKSLLIAISALTIMMTTASAEQAPATKPRILVHLTSGPENPTKAALAFLVARTAVEQGHAVSLFLAGDAVQVLRDAALDNLAGLGTGKLREHFDVIAKGGGRFYLSGMSSNARGITAAELQGKPAELAPPTILLKLALEHDRMFTY